MDCALGKPGDAKFLPIEKGLLCLEPHANVPRTPCLSPGMRVKGRRAALVWTLGRLIANAATTSTSWSIDPSVSRTGALTIEV